jgi:hypothetical protein
LNTWFNRAYLQECVHAMLAIKRSSPFQRLWLLALVHAKARASKLACVQGYVFVIMLLLKLVSVEASVQVYVRSILRECTHSFEYESGRASLRTSPPMYVEACLRRACIYVVVCVRVRTSLLVFKHG